MASQIYSGPVLDADIFEGMSRHHTDSQPAFYVEERPSLICRSISAAAPLPRYRRLNRWLFVWDEGRKGWVWNR